MRQSQVALALLPGTIKSLALGFHTEYLALQNELLRLAATKANKKKLYEPKT
jgi:hypothetical protein